MPNCSATAKESLLSLPAWQTISDAFAFLAAVLNNRPGEDMIAGLRQRFNDEKLPLHHESSSYRLIAGYLNYSESQPAAVLIQELSVEWTRLFRGISPVYGPQPPYAGVYNSGDGIGVNALMAITQMYSSYGLEVRSDNLNRADYLGVQLDFISILAQRAAQDAGTGNSAAEEATAAALLDFLHNHLWPWVDEYAAKAQEYAQTDFFRGYLLLLSESLNELKVLIRD